MDREKDASSFPQLLFAGQSPGGSSRRKHVHHAACVFSAQPSAHGRTKLDHAPHSPRYFPVAIPAPDAF